MRRRRWAANFDSLHLAKRFHLCKLSPKCVAILDFLLSPPAIFLGVFVWAPRYEYYFAWTYFAFCAILIAFFFRYVQYKIWSETSIFHCFRRGYSFSAISFGWELTGRLYPISKSGWYPFSRSPLQNCCGRWCFSSLPSRSSPKRRAMASTRCAQYILVENIQVIFKFAALFAGDFKISSRFRRGIPHYDSKWVHILRSTYSYVFCVVVFT